MIFSFLATICLALAFILFYAAEAGAPGFLLGWHPSHQSAITIGIFSIALATLGKR